MKSDILIFASHSFPYGDAATNRIISYAKMLAEDFKVRYVSITPDFLRNPANLPKGVYKGIEYEYATGDNYWNPEWSKWKKGLKLIKGRLNLIRILILARPRTVILVSRDIKILKLLILLSKIFNFRLILEVTELTRFRNDYDRKTLRSLYSKIYGVLCISKEIVDYIQSFCNGLLLFHLPMSVDISRFPVDRRYRRESDKYFAICSGNNWERDGAIDSLKAFLDLRKSNPEYKLKIAGALNDNTEYNREFKRMVESNLKNGVEYLGLLSGDRIPEFIMGATAALLTPHKDYESGGFPTKLGEYLASGVPVVCTSVSEIPNYLNTDNSFISAPNDLENIVKNMLWITQNIDEASKVGRKGRHIAETIFNAYSYKTQLKKFIIR